MTPTVCRTRFKPSTLAVRVRCMECNRYKRLGWTDRRPNLLLQLPRCRHRWRCAQHRYAGMSSAIECDGDALSPYDIVVAEGDGVVVVPRAKAAQLLLTAQKLDKTERSIYPASRNSTQLLKRYSSSAKNTLRVQPAGDFEVIHRD